LSIRHLTKAIFISLVRKKETENFNFVDLCSDEVDQGFVYLRQTFKKSTLRPKNSRGSGTGQGPTSTSGNLSQAWL